MTCFSQFGDDGEHIRLGINLANLVQKAQGLGGQQLIHESRLSVLLLALTLTEC